MSEKMADGCPALLLSPEAFELISSHLNLAELCSLESTCTAFRKLGLACSPSPITAVATPLKGRLDNEEKIDSLGFFLYRRGSRLQHLKYEHLDCQRHNVIVFNAFTNISTTLSSLHLVISKDTKNRRGIPGAASFSYMPIFPNLKSLILEFQWSVTENFELIRWTPNLKELCLRVPSTQHRFITDLFQVLPSLGRFENPLPESLESFKAVGLCGRVPFQSEWFKRLTSVSIEYPTKFDGENALVLAPRRVGLDPDDCSTIRSWLPSEVEDLALDTSRVGISTNRSFSFDPSGEYLVSILANLKKLKRLKWANTDAVRERGPREKLAIIELLKSFSGPLECLHILGRLPGWQTAVLQGAFSQVTELAIITNTSREAYLPNVPCLPNLEHLIVNLLFIKTSAENQQHHSAEFAAHLKNLKKITILTSGATCSYDIYDTPKIARYLIGVIHHAGHPIAVDIEGREYVSRLETYLEREGVTVGAVGDEELAGCVEIWNKWEYDDQMEAIQN
jgi:hypothetical protein